MQRLIARLPLVAGNPILLFAIAYTASAVVQKGLGFLLFLWFARALTVEDYALFGLLYSLQTAVAALAMAGIVETSIGGLKGAEDIERRRDLLNSAALVQIALGCASIVLVVLGFCWSSMFSATALITAATGGALVAFFTIQAQLSRIIERHKVALLISFAPVMIGLLGGFTGYLIQGTALSFFVGQAAGLVFALPLVAFTPVGFPKWSDRSHVRYILTHLGPFVLVALVDWFGGYGNTYLVKVFFSSSEVARFVFAYTLSAIMHLVATSMNQAWSPRVFSLIHASPGTVEAENRKFYLIQGAVLGAAGGLVLFLLPLAVALFGNDLAHYRGLEVEVAILFAAYVLVVPWYHVQNYYYAHGSGPLLMRITVISSLFGIGLWITCASSFGAFGAYLGFLAMMLAKMIGGLLGARRRWQVEILWHGPAIGLALILAGLWFGLAVWTQS